MPANSIYFFSHCTIFQKCVVSSLKVSFSFFFTGGISLISIAFIYIQVMGFSFPEICIH